MEVSKAVGLRLKDFHLGMEALSNSVVAGEAPHTSDFISPSEQRLAQLHEWCEPAATERIDAVEEATR